MVFFIIILNVFLFESVWIAIPPSQCLVASALDGRGTFVSKTCGLLILYNSAVVKTKIQKKKKEHMRSERSCWPLLLPSRGLITRRSRPAALLSRVSLQPWIKAQTLSTTLHSLWPSFAVYSSIFEACLKHVLFLWYWPYGANVYVQYLATVVHPCGGPRAWWGSPRCRF